MTCKNCGNEMRDDARFCPHCGTLNGPDQSAGQAAVPAWEGPEDGGKKKKTGLIIAAVAAVAAVAVVLVVALGGLFSNPKKQVEAAFVKSAAAYAAAEERLGLPDIQQWQQDKAIAQRMSLELKSINSDLVGMDLSALSGLGLGLSTDYSGAERWLSYNLRAYWGEEELLSLRAAADDAEFYFNSPQITGDVFYGANTETLGVDLAARSAEDEEEIKNISFNVFDLIDQMLEQINAREMEKAVSQANKALWAQAKVKKTGARTMDINGADIKTAAYRVTIPEEALYQYVDDMELVLAAMNYFSIYEEMLRSAGLPQDEIDNIMGDLDTLDLYGDLADSFRDLVDELGDLELNVCLSGGYVAAVEYEGRVDGSEMKVSVLMGGSGEYVDDVSVNIESPSLAIDIESSGDHGLKSGVYTDETTARIRQFGSTLARVTSELTIDPKSQKDNLQWKLGVDSSGLSIFVLDIKGDLTLEKDCISLDSEEVSVRAVGMEVCQLALSYYVDCRPVSEPVSNPRLVTQMDEEELMAMVLDTQERVMVWGNEMEQLFLTRLPQELLWDLMSVY